MEGKHFSKEMLRLKWYGIEQRKYSLVEIFNQHNDQLKTLIGKDNSKATYTKYRTTLDHTVKSINDNNSVLRKVFLSQGTRKIPPLSKRDFLNHHSFRLIT